MLIGQIVLKLRLGDTTFGDLIGGSAELALVLNNTLTGEMAFVIPLKDDATSNQNDIGINQRVNERFGVVVALKNDSSASNKLGLVTYDRLHAIRAEIWSAILGWIPSGYEYPITYAGGKLLDINPAYLWYQFEFIHSFRIDNDDGIEQGNLDNFDTLYADWVMSPSANLPISEGLPIGGFTPDMTSSIDFTEDPNDGGFDRGFHTGFKTYKGY
jgi:hypothetical protein